MATNPTIRLVGAQSPIIPTGGKSVVIMPNTANIYGGFIINPSEITGQSIAIPESLFISVVGPAAISANETTVEVVPGAAYTIPGGVTVWGNAISDGHRFTAMFGQPFVIPPPKEIDASLGWPPTSATGLKAVMYAYVYQEYSDDDDVQAIFAAVNAMQQDYVDTFNALTLPAYPNPLIAGALADWVIQGIYGYPRPALYSQVLSPIGPLNTYWPNYNVALNDVVHLAATDLHMASDDVYKRCLTWHFQKGDGRYFNVRWLKRRIMRFLIGVNGTSPHIDNTDRISIEFGDDYDVTIRIVAGQSTVTGGAMPNRFGPNGVIDDKTRGPAPVTPNTIFTTYEAFPAFEMASQFQEAVQAGILELPFQFAWDVVIE